MKGKFGAVTQVSLALLLSLSLGFMTAGPSMAQESPQESVSISPEKAEYNLDDPHLVSTRITWGDASGVEAITDGRGYELQQGRDDDYMVLGKTLLILNHYLKQKLTKDRESRESVVLTIQFDVGLNATFTIKAIRTQPTIDPEVAFYELEDRDDVKTTIEWHEAEATKVVSIFDNDRHRLQEDSDYTIEVVTKSTTARLAILNEPYLARKLENDGDHVVLTIEFDVGDDATFNITAIENPPSISPDKAEYDLDKRADVLTTITRGAAKAVDAVTEGDNPLTVGDDYTVEDIGGDKPTLTILNDYLADELKDEDIGESVVLTIEFDVGDPVAFNITAKGTHPTVDPGDAIYDVGGPADVNTTITWRHATGVVSITDSDNPLTRDDHYTVGQTVEGEATLTINKSYLDGKLKAWEDKVELSINFDFGDDRTVTIRAVDAHPTIDPETAKYDLNDPADITITITWQEPPTKVVSIVDGEDALVRDAHYSVTRTDDGTATLEIDHLSYLRFEISVTGKKVELTVAFSVGDDAKLVITAVRNPRIDPDDAHYNWDDPPDFVQTGITWGVPRDIDIEITDNKRYVLTEGEDGDYMVLDNTLVILDKYLRDKLSDLKPVTLTIAFSDGPSHDFNIKPHGTSATISPPREPYARHAPHDVATTITWGSATKAESVVDDDAYELVEDEDYTVIPIDDDKATLTIFHAPYLERRFEDSPTSLNLTIDFDVGDDRIFVVTTGGCFIATAAYGTPMAEQIQILREFRDEYLLTNPLGQAFVDFYYRTSPPIAEFINEHPTLKPIVRAGLLPAVAMSAMVVNTTLAEKTVIAGLLLLVSVAVAIWATRQRGGGPQYS